MTTPQPPIKATIHQLLRAETVLDRLSADRSLSNQAASHVRKLRRLSREETSQLREANDKFLEEHGTKRDPSPEEAFRNGGKPMFTISPLDKMWPEMHVLLDGIGKVEVEIAWRPLTLAELGDVRLSADDQDGLGPLLADDEVDA